MTHSKLLTVLAVLALGAGFARAESTWFVTPVAGHLSYGDSKFSGETSYGLAAGALFGVDKAHEFSVEWTYAKLSYVDAPAPGVVGGSTTRAEGNIQPLLLGYRYHFGPADSRFRLFVGPAVGLTRSSGDGRNDAPVSFGAYTGSFSHWSTSLGGSAGAGFEFAPGLSLQLGYRYLHIDTVADFTARRVEGPTELPIDLGAVDTHFVFAALRWAF